MSDIQQARDVLAKWRDGATPGPWKRSLSGIDGENYGEVVFPGDVSCMAYCYGGSSTIDGDNLDSDFRLIVGTAGNPELLDAVDKLLAAADVPAVPMTIPVILLAKPIAAAIIAAEERMRS
jgi:hypothetical protein